MSTQNTSDIIIIGGGVIGLMAAWQLAKRGLQVTLFEKDRPGQEASSAALGILLPGLPSGHIATDRYATLTHISLELYPELAADLLTETGVDIELREEGVLDVAINEAELTQFAEISQLCRRANIPVATFSPADTLALAPQLNPEIKGGLLFKSAKQVENRRLCTALTLAARQAGARLHNGRVVSEFIKDRNCVTGVMVNGEAYTAAKVILAAGSWSGQVQGFSVPVRPTKGQALALEAPFVLHYTIHSEAGYVAPRRDGRILIGATVEEAGFDKRSTVAGVFSLLERAMSLFPALREATILETWAGLRPRAIDDWPVLGPVVGYEGLIAATGHFKNGILLAPATAQLLIDWATDQTPEIDVACFSPNRF